MERKKEQGLHMQQHKKEGGDTKRKALMILITLMLLTSIFPYNLSLGQDIGTSDIIDFRSTLIKSKKDYIDAGYDISKIENPVFYKREVLAEGHLPIVLDIECAKQFYLETTEKNNFLSSIEINKWQIGKITYTYKILTREDFIKDIPIYKYTTEKVFDKKNNTYVDKTTSEITGYDHKNDYKYVWKDIKYLEKIDFKLQNKIIIDIQGNFKAQMGDRRVDIVPDISIGDYNKQLTKYDWWSSDWDNYKPITLSNIISGGVVNLNVTYDDEMNSDFSDLRFLDDDNTTELDYWIEYKVNDSFCRVWVETSDGGNTIIMYYGNDAATSDSDGFETFIFFDDWNDDEMSGWTEEDSDDDFTISFIDGKLKMLRTGGSNGQTEIIYNDENFSSLDKFMMFKSYVNTDDNSFSQYDEGFFVNASRYYGGNSDPQIYIDYRDSNYDWEFVVDTGPSSSSTQIAVEANYPNQIWYVGGFNNSASGVAGWYYEDFYGCSNKIGDAMDTSHYIDEPNMRVWLVYRCFSVNANHWELFDWVFYDETKSDGTYMSGILGEEVNYTGGSVITLSNEVPTDGATDVYFELFYEQNMSRDWNSDGIVDYEDLNLLIGDIGNPASIYDIDGDGDCDISDVSSFTSQRDYAILFSINVTHLTGETCNASFYTNASGSWALMGYENDIVNQTANSTLFDYLDCNTTYWWRVNVTDNNGNWTNSSVYSFTTMCCNFTLEEFPFHMSTMVDVPSNIYIDVIMPGGETTIVGNITHNTSASDIFAMANTEYRLWTSKRSCFEIDYDFGSYVNVSIKDFKIRCRTNKISVSQGMVDYIYLKINGIELGTADEFKNFTYDVNEQGSNDTCYYLEWNGFTINFYNISELVFEIYKPINEGLGWAGADGFFFPAAPNLNDYTPTDIDGDGDTQCKNHLVSPDGTYDGSNVKFGGDNETDPIYEFKYNLLDAPTAMQTRTGWIRHNTSSGNKWDDINDVTYSTTLNESSILEWDWKSGETMNRTITNVKLRMQGGNVNSETLKQYLWLYINGNGTAGNPDRFVTFTYPDPACGSDETAKYYEWTDVYFTTNTSTIVFELLCDDDNGTGYTTYAIYYGAFPNYDDNTATDIDSDGDERCRADDDPIPAYDPNGVYDGDGVYFGPTRSDNIYEIWWYNASDVLPPTFYNISVVFEENSTGSWRTFNETDTQVQTLFKRYRAYNNTWITNYSHKYWWRVKVIRSWGIVNGIYTIETYNFTTRPNYPAVLLNEYPTNTSENVTADYVSIDLWDGENDTLTWTIEMSTGDNSSGVNFTGDTIRCDFDPIGECGENITWWVNVTDGFNWTNESFWFVMFPIYINWTYTETNQLVEFTSTTCHTIDIDFWNWDFGDGHHSFERSPDHYYTSVGNYSVTLEIENTDYGIVLSLTKNVQVGTPDVVTEKILFDFDWGIFISLIYVIVIIIILLWFVRGLDQFEEDIFDE